MTLCVLLGLEPLATAAAAAAAAAAVTAGAVAGVGPGGLRDARGRGRFGVAAPGCV